MKFVDERTITLAKSEESNFSVPSLCLDKSTDVAITIRAFFEKIKVAIITNPEISNINPGVFTSPDNIPIEKPSGAGDPAAIHASYEL